MKKTIAVLFLATFLFSSCMVTKTSVGKYKEQEGKSYSYDKGKQYWLLWGIMPMGNQQVSTPTTGSCQISEKYTIFDMVISGITGGILTSRTIEVRAKR